MSVVPRFSFEKLVVAALLNLRADSKQFPLILDLDYAVHD